MNGGQQLKFSHFKQENSAETKALAEQVKQTKTNLLNDKVQFLQTEVSELNTDLQVAQTTGQQCRTAEQNQKIAEWQTQRAAMQADLDAARKELEQMSKQDPAADKRTAATLRIEQKHIAIAEAELNKQKDVDALKNLQRDIDIESARPQYATRQSPARNQARISSLTGAKASREQALIGTIDELRLHQLDMAKNSTMLGSTQVSRDAVEKLKASFKSLSGNLSIEKLSELQDVMTDAMPSLNSRAGIKTVNELKSAFDGLSPELKAQLNDKLSFGEILSRAAATKKVGGR